MNENEAFSSLDSTWKNCNIPRGKPHNKTATKTTVSLYLSKKAVEKARKHKLNISRITEQALTSVINYLETSNQPKRKETHPSIAPITGAGDGS